MLDDHKATALEAGVDPHPVSTKGHAKKGKGVHNHWKSAIGKVLSRQKNRDLQYIARLF